MQGYRSLAEAPCPCTALLDADQLMSDPMHAVRSGAGLPSL